MIYLGFLHELRLRSNLGDVVSFHRSNGGHIYANRAAILRCDLIFTRLLINLQSHNCSDIFILNLDLDIIYNNLYHFNQRSVKLVNHNLHHFSTK